MPMYKFSCPKCHNVFDVKLSMSDIGQVAVECDECLVEANREYVNPMVTVPANMRATLSDNYYGKESRIPINIIDEKPDGGYRVTRIGKKGDLDNE